MYIRRKVFSTYIDENGEERLFSTTELVDEETYLEKIYSENPEQKEFNSKAAKQRNAKFFEDKGREGLKKLIKEEGAATIEKEMPESITNAENYINRKRVNSKIDKLEKFWLNNDFASDYDGYVKARKAYEGAERFKVGYGERPINEAYKKLGITKKSLTTKDVLKGVGRSALKEEAKEIANKQKSKMSRGAILTKKSLKELK